MAPPARLPATAAEPTTGHLHEAFLERASSPTAGSSGHALGAFLALRIADQFASGAICADIGALEYQMDSTGDYLRHLHPQDAEVSHLLEIVRIAEAAAESGNVRLLWPPMLAYAYWLEQELRGFEALDALETVLRTSDGRDADEEVAALYQRGRVLRKLSRYEPAETEFLASAGMAERLGDRHSELSAHVGRAIVLEKIGNLPEAEELLGAVIIEAMAMGDVDVEARARHDLANTLMVMNRPDDAVVMAYRAVELYERPQQRLRALSDLGMAFKMLGNLDAAGDAFHVVLASEHTTPEMRINTTLELLDLASRTRNRVSFERWRRELAVLEPVMAPDALIDLDLKLGAGFAAFDQPDRSERALRRAIARAEEHGVNAYLFQAERLLRDLRAEDGPPIWQSGDGVNADPPPSGPEARRIAERLQALRAGVT